MPKKPLKKTLTREDRRTLDVEIGFIEGVVRRDPDYVEALQILGDDYTKRGRFLDGLKVDEQLARLRPADSRAATRSPATPTPRLPRCIARSMLATTISSGLHKTPISSACEITPTTRPSARRSKI